MTYTIQQLAPGSNDVLLDGALAVFLVREVGRSGVVREWLIELLDETSAAERPALFRAQQHAFATCTAALECLGIRGDGISNVSPR